MHSPRPNGGSPQGRTGHRTRGRGCPVAEAPRFAARLSAAGPQRTSWAAHLPWRGRALPKGEAPLSLRKTAGGSATPLPGRGRARSRPASEGPRSAKRRGAAHPHTMAGAIRQTQPSPRRCLATKANQSPARGRGWVDGVCPVVEAPRSATWLGAADPPNANWAALLPWRGRALPEGEAPLALPKTAGGNVGWGKRLPTAEAPRSARRLGAADPPQTRARGPPPA